MDIEGRQEVEESDAARTQAIKRSQGEHIQ